jgi:hypothetical protein
MNNLDIIESVILKGDLSVLTQKQKLEYYSKVCESVGLNPLTKPLEYIRLNQKEVLYATKGATEQLRNIHGISIKIVDKQKIDEVYIVTAEATGKDGRCDSATGAVPIGGLKGDQLANAFMKCETKAKRRVTLSICGLNMLDESEVETIPNVEKKFDYIESERSAIQNENKPFPLELTSEPKPQSANPATTKQLELIKKLLVDQLRFEIDTCKKYIKELTGKDSTKELSFEDASIVISTAIKQTQENKQAK